MRFNTAPASVLFIKLYENKRPYSKDVLHLSLIASDMPIFKANKALYTMVVPDEVETDFELVKMYCEKLCARYNYAEFKLLTEE
jgi:hypothetical protein